MKAAKQNIRRILASLDDLEETEDLTEEISSLNKELEEMAGRVERMVGKAKEMADRVEELGPDVADDFELMQMIELAETRKVFVFSENDEMSHCRALLEMASDARVWCSFHGQAPPVPRGLGIQRVYSGIRVENLSEKLLPFSIHSVASNRPGWVVWWQAPYAKEDTTARLLQDFVRAMEKMLQPGDQVLIGWASNYESEGGMRSNVYDIPALLRFARPRWEVDPGRHTFIGFALAGYGYEHRASNGYPLTGKWAPGQWCTVKMTLL